MDILTIKSLTKRFGKFTAVDEISFDLKEGEILGLLGPNGAGKTTTIQMLLGITTPTTGTIAYFGKDFFQNKQYCLQRINYTSAFNTLQGRTTVWENLLVFSHLYQIPDPRKKIVELIEYFEMRDLLHKRYWDLSAGQRTRTNFMKALLNDPQVILMDEPTASLDPDIADKTLTLIEQLRRDRKLSILFTSHNMPEVTRICDRVIFLDHGKIVAHDTPLGLTKQFQSAELKLTFDKNKEAIVAYLQKEKQTFRFEGAHVVHITTQETDIPGLIFELKRIGIWITDIEVKKPTLEDVFLEIARGTSHVFQKN